jgi:hypothetical protein
MCNACLDAGLSRRRVVLSAAGLLAAAPLAGIARAQPMAAADSPDAAPDASLAEMRRFKDTVLARL